MREIGGSQEDEIAEVVGESTISRKGSQHGL